MLTGMTPIIIKLEEMVKRFNIKRRLGNRTLELDYGEELKYWPHPADAVTIKEVAGNEEASVQANTDGSKHDKGVGPGGAIFIGSEMVVQLKKN